jgi:Kef-type K+ transport system membrane component KefB
MLLAQRRVTRIIAFALWFANVVYFGIYTLVVLQGRPGAFFASPASAPWGNPVLPVLLALGAITPVPALLLRHVLLGRAAAVEDLLQRILVERTAMIVSAAMFESVGICGLVLGFIAGPAAAPLSALLLLVPLAAIPFLLPPHARFDPGDSAPGGGEGGSLRPR